MGNHLPYGITQCYLPPGRGDFPAFTPAEADTRFSNPEGMQGWFDLGTLGANSLPKTVTRQRRDCDSNPCSSEPKCGTLTTRPPSHPIAILIIVCISWIQYSLITFNLFNVHDTINKQMKANRHCSKCNIYNSITKYHCISHTALQAASTAIGRPT